MSLQLVIILGIVFLFSIYSFCYANLDSGLDYKVMSALSFLAGLVLVSSKSIGLSKQTVFLYVSLLGLATLSVFLPFSEYATINQLVEALAMLLLCSVIVLGFRVNETRGQALLKWGLLGCLAALTLMIILHQSGIPIKKAFPEFAGFRLVAHEWNQKHFSFWQVFLTWGVIAFHWNKGRLGTFIAISVTVLTGLTLSMGYSDSAPVAFGLSLVVFILMHLPYRGWLRIGQALIWLYVFAFPWVWSLIPASWFSVIKSIPLNNVGFRVDLYRFSAELIQEQWLVGYGFGSAAPLLQPFPFDTGGHPHNIVLYFWLELGLFGAIVLAQALTTLLTFVHNATHDQAHAPAVWALVSAGLVIFSFSFDIWLPGIVLMYGMWLAMIALACGIDLKPQKV
jgi:O-antigen ligase